MRNDGHKVRDVLGFMLDNAGSGVFDAALERCSAHEVGALKRALLAAVLKDLQPSPVTAPFSQEDADLAFSSLMSEGDFEGVESLGGDAASALLEIVEDWETRYDPEF